MTAAAGAIAGSDNADRAWRTVRDMDHIQFAPLPPEPAPDPAIPEWLAAVLRFLGDLLAPLGRLLGRNWGAIEIVLVAGAVAGAAWIAWSLLWPRWRDRRRGVAAEPEWAPDRSAARALLEEADALAAQGRFSEAAHLLLRRSVDHIADARPEWLSPSATAREIGGIAGLPAAAARAFAVIAGEVERSLFALRDLGAEDWGRARTAYAEFALADLSSAP